ncbi:MAG: recombinase family protein [Brevundimonas sp.]
MRAVIYIRYSTPIQEKGASRDRQLELCQQFCEQRGWPVDEVIEDLGRSAWTGAHLAIGGLGRFADQVRDGSIGPDVVLVVEKLDRLSRQETRTTLRWMEDLCAAGLTIATVDGGKIYDDAGLRADLMNVFEILMRAKLAYDESQQKSERITDRFGRNIERARMTGQIITAKAPGWLVAKADRSGFDVIDDRAQMVRDVYQMAADGKGARWIAKELNEKGIPAWGHWRKEGSTPTWEIGSVKMILSQPSVEGDYMPGHSNTSAKRTKFDQRVVGYYPRIVDADLVARARAQVEARRTGPRTGGGHTRGVANLFASVVVCEACGNRMHLRSSGRIRYWQCNYAARSRGCTQKEMFRYEPFERAALDEILHLALDDRYFAQPDSTASAAAALAGLEKAIADQKEQVDHWVESLGRIGSSEALEAKLVDAERSLRALGARRDEAVKVLDAAKGAVSPAQHLERVRDVRAALDDPDRAVRLAARLKVHNAIVALDCKVVCGVDPEDGRQIALLLPGNVLACLFDNDGQVVMRFDGLEFTQAVFPDLEGEALAQRVEATLKAYPVEDQAWRGPGVIGRGWLATYITRHRKGRSGRQEQGAMQPDPPMTTDRER